MTAAVVIGICWHMNHWLGIVWNAPGRIWVDQGWAVSAAQVKEHHPGFQAAKGSAAPKEDAGTREAYRKLVPVFEHAYLSLVDVYDEMAGLNL